MNKCQFLTRTIKRMANAGAGGGLPSMYQQVSFLERTGAQAIDTGLVIPDNYLRVVGKYSATRFSSGMNDQRFFGSQSNAQASLVPYHWQGTGPFSMFRVGTTDYTMATATYRGADYEIDIIANGGTATGVYCGENINLTYSGSVATGKHEGLFYNNANSSSVSGNQGACRVYYHTLHTSAGKARELIPCYRKSDNKPGMYDLVTKQFYTNIGTDDFIIGTPVNILPAEYQQVEYLESTGDQVIDLGSLWTENLVTTVEFALTSSFTFANTSYLFGGYNSGNAYSVSFPSDTSFRVPVSNNFENFTIASLSTMRHIIEYRRGSLVYDGSTTTFTGAPISTLRRYLFGRYNGSSSVQIAGIRVYRYTDATSNGTQHDLIPCYRKADSVTGMYNLIDNTFTPYTGTANFIVGADV